MRSFMESGTTHLTQRVQHINHVILLQLLSLKEVVDGLVVIAKMSNWFDTLEDKDNGDHYQLIITHSLGLNNSILNKEMFESVFKTYGVKVESTISEKMIFMNIFKN